MLEVIKMSYVGKLFLKIIILFSFGILAHFSEPLCLSKGNSLLVAMNNVWCIYISMNSMNKNLDEICNCFKCVPNDGRLQNLTR